MDDTSLKTEGVVARLDPGPESRFNSGSSIAKAASAC